MSQFIDNISAPLTQTSNLGAPIFGQADPLGQFGLDSDILKYERLEDMPIFQEFKTKFASPEFKDETRIALETTKWGKWVTEHE